MQKNVLLRSFSGSAMENKNRIARLLGMLVLLATVGCLVQAVGKKQTVCEKQLFAMDTYMTFKAIGPQAEEAVDAAIRETERLDALLSTGRETSEVSKINAAGSGSVSEDTAVLLQRSMEYYESTQGLFDITIYPLMELWGFPTKEYHVPSEKELEEALSVVGTSKISFDGKNLLLEKGQKIDFGGIAKGYTSAKVIELMKTYGVEDAMVSLGGNVQTIGKNAEGKLWKIGIRDPRGEENEMLGVLPVSGKAVITSGGYERYFEADGETYIHILDPATGKPAEGTLLSATIISEDGTLADAMSTSMYLMGAEGAESYWKENGDEFDMILVTEDQIYITEGIADDFQCSQQYEVLTRN